MSVDAPHSLSVLVFERSRFVFVFYTDFFMALHIAQMTIGVTTITTPIIMNAISSLKNTA